MSFAALRTDHDAARGRWEAAVVRDYDVTYEIDCSRCVDTGATVSVRDGAVVAAEFVNPEVPLDLEPRTVDAILDEVRAAIDDRPYTIDAAYDPQLGYPVSFDVDRDDRSGDEQSLRVVSFARPAG